MTLRFPSRNKITPRDMRKDIDSETKIFCLLHCSLTWGNRHACIGDEEVMCYVIVYHSLLDL